MAKQGTGDLFLSRRHLRVKVVQAYYGFAASEGQTVTEADRALMDSITRLHDSLLVYLYFFVELAFFSLRHADEQDSKPGNILANIHQSRTFGHNPLATAIHDASGLVKHLKRKGLNDDGVLDILRAVWREVRELPALKAHEDSDYTPESAAAIMTAVIKHLDKLPEPIPVAEGEPEEPLPTTASTLLFGWMEEINLSWPSDRALVVDNALKVVKSYGQTSKMPELPINLGDTEAVDFARKLLKQTILHDGELQVLIQDHTPNWDGDRIAMTDTVLIKVGLAETMFFPDIPTKVTINEYIDIAKRYSTPKSGQFVNGVLDTLIKVQAEKGLVTKTGTGLLDKPAQSGHGIPKAT